MMPVTPKEFLPIELIFNPNWWNQMAGISFDQAFYLDAKTRIQNDVTMCRVLHERYGELGLGEFDRDGLWTNLGDSASGSLAGGTYLAEQLLVWLELFRNKNIQVRCPHVVAGSLGAGAEGDAVVGGTAGAPTRLIDGRAMLQLGVLPPVQGTGQL